jgi:hypothetical protein
MPVNLDAGDEKIWIIDARRGAAWRKFAQIAHPANSRSQACAWHCDRFPLGTNFLCGVSGNSALLAFSPGPHFPNLLHFLARAHIEHRFPKSDGALHESLRLFRPDRLQRAQRFQ